MAKGDRDPVQEAADRALAAEEQPNAVLDELLR